MAVAAIVVDVFICEAVEGITRFAHGCGGVRCCCGEI